MTDLPILDFIAESGKLKNIKRSGWWMVGIPREESVAEHSFRCAVIAYILAKDEGADVYRTMLMALFNDIHEARINDSHKVASRYIDVREAEKKAFREQVRPLPAPLKDEMEELRKDYDEQLSIESIVARDADILECLIQAKEYSDAGFSAAKKFFTAAPSHLKTESAKKLWEGTREWDSNGWWEKLGRFDR